MLDERWDSARLDEATEPDSYVNVSVEEKLPARTSSETLTSRRVTRVSWEEATPVAASLLPIRLIGGSSGTGRGRAEAIPPLPADLRFSIDAQLLASQTYDSSARLRPSSHDRGVARNLVFTNVSVAFLAKTGTLMRCW